MDSGAQAESPTKDFSSSWRTSSSSNLHPSSMASLDKKHSSDPDKDSKLSHDHVKLDTTDAFEESAQYQGATVSLERNVNAILQNPLAGIPKEQLMINVKSFCNMAGLIDQLDIFEKAALIAQEPNEWRKVPDLLPEESESLEREITHKWSLPRQLWLLIFVISLGSAIQGWDNTGANGAILSFPQEFGIADNAWLVGFLNSAPTISGLISAWFCDPVNNLIGRKKTIFVTGLFTVFPVLGQAFTHTWWELAICRLLLGVGIGCKITTIPIMTAESVPATIRGGLVMSFQLFVAFGIFIGFCSNMIFYNIGVLAWRFELAAAFVPAVPLCVLIWWVPESPRWLIKKERYAESYSSFCRLRNSPIQAARDLYSAYVQVELERHTVSARSSTYASRMMELFTVPRVRRATLGSFIVMIGQQMCGINIMAFYSSTIFVEAGYTTKQALSASLGFGAVNTLFALPAIKTIDTFGRRSLLLFTFPNMAWCLFAAGATFTMSPENSARVPLLAFFIYLFTAFYSPGMGPVPAVYASECFPLSHREMGMGWSIFVNNFFSTILSLTFPTMLKTMGPTGAICFYGGLNIMATIMVFFGLPETKKYTLEELDYVFAVPTSRHASYQIRTWLPWFIKRWVFWQRTAVLQPLYRFAEPSQATTVSRLAKD